MSFSGKDLNLLIALRALLEEANVTRAGERIDMGQSSMSTALSRLRLQFGDELLVRVGRDYELTPLARLILPQLQLTLPLIESALMSHEAFDPATSKRVFKIMMSDFSSLQLKPVISRALAEAPNIEIDIEPLPADPTDSEREMMSHDFVVSPPGLGIEGEKFPLFQDRYVCILDKNNPALEDGKLSWEAFITLPQVVVNFGRAHITPPARRLSELGFRVEPHVRTTSYLSIPSVIKGTNLVGIVGSRMANVLEEGSSLITVEAPFGEVGLYQTLWWHHSYNNDEAHQWLRGILTSGNL
ncbi:MAG: hypothetical protein RL508_526 [Actinomycetota bacterium]